jgi:hypothetical protein
MENDEVSDVSNDPFSPENVDGVQAIILMRIYDVLLGLYREQNAEYAERLVELHEAGKIMGPLPWLDLSEE